MPIIHSFSHMHVYVVPNRFHVHLGFELELDLGCYSSIVPGVKLTLYR